MIVPQDEGHCGAILLGSNDDLRNYVFMNRELPSIVVIRLIPQYAESPVELLEHKQPHHLVVESHLGKRDFGFYGGVDFGAESECTTDDEYQPLVPGPGVLLQFCSKGPAAVLGAIFVEKHGRIAGNEGAQQGLTFSFFAGITGQFPPGLFLGNHLDLARGIVFDAGRVLVHALANVCGSRVTDAENDYFHESKGMKARTRADQSNLETEYGVIFAISER